MTAIPADTRSEVEKLERKHADNPEGRYFVPLANAYRKAGNVDQAIRVLRQGLAKHPEYVSAHIVLGRCFTDGGNLDAATAEFQHVLSLDGQNLVALRTLGELAVASNKLGDAKKWYGDLLAVDPMNEEAREALDSIAEGTAGSAARPGVGAEIGSDSTAQATDSGSEPQPVVMETQPTPRPPASALSREQTPPSPFDEPSGFDAEMVVTETIAELYTKQGFLDRAAVVYRELIRRRGEEPRLVERLARVERMASGEPEPAPVAPSPDPEPFAATAEVVEEAVYDAFAESFEAGFPASSADFAREQPTESVAEAVAEAPEATNAGVTGAAGNIRALLRQVFKLQPVASELRTPASGAESANLTPAIRATEIPPTPPDAFSEGPDGWTGDWSPREQGITEAPADTQDWVAETTELEASFEPPGDQVASPGMFAETAGPSVPWEPSPSPESDVEGSRHAEHSASPESWTTRDLEAEADQIAPAAGHREESGYTYSPFASDAIDETATSGAADEPPFAGLSHGSTSAETPVPPDSGAAQSAADLDGLAPQAFDDDLFPWELPEDHSGGGSFAQESEMPEVRLDLPTDRPADPISQQPAIDEAQGADEMFDAVPEPVQQTPEPRKAPPPDDDDDLESFQAWLRSLKR